MYYVFGLLSISPTLQGQVSLSVLFTDRSNRLEQCLAYHRGSINICEMNEWGEGIKDVLSQRVEPSTPKRKHRLRHGEHEKLRSKGPAKHTWSSKLTLGQAWLEALWVCAPGEGSTRRPHPSILSKRSWDGTGNKWPTDQAEMGAV